MSAGFQRDGEQTWRTAVRQFLGMINDVLFWPHMLIVDLSSSVEEADQIVSAAVGAMVRAYGSAKG